MVGTDRGRYDGPMSRSVIIALFLLNVLIVGCGGVRFEHDPISYSAPAAAFWVSPLETHASAAEPKAPLRRKAVAFAEERARSEAIIRDFGQTDAADLFDALKKRVGWTADKPLSTLIQAAERRDAYDSRKLPRPGDIVLFHNQADRNNNRIADDWLTGCGIVLDRRDRTFTALARTGRGPRVVIVTPQTPSIRSRDGRVINSYLRVPSAADPPDAEYLAGLLFAGSIDITNLLAR